MQQNKRPNLVSLTTINPDGSHYVLHPADVSGRFTFFRRIFGIVLIAVYVLMPWIPINGAPALFFDVENRRFHMFGLTLLTQDLWVFFFAISGLGFVLFFITALLGRLWCGWACPYTVFLEHVFRRIERWIDLFGASRSSEETDSEAQAAAQDFDSLIDRLQSTLMDPEQRARLSEDSKSQLDSTARRLRGNDKK